MPQQTKVFRVFVSSTFRDMHAERDYLNRFVFPELRSRCQKRGAEFLGLDLRWGVTEEEVQREGALKICLDEIERCRPFFVCLLGDRYGWVPPPDEVPTDRFQDALNSSPILALADWYTLDESSVPPVYRLRRDRAIPEEMSEAITQFWEDANLPNAGHSITAREILRSVFEKDFPATHALFYLRKSGFEAAPNFPRAFVPVFIEQDAKRRTKRDVLEVKIRSCTDRMVVREYDVGVTGLQIDSNLLPDTLSTEERKELGDRVITMDMFERLSAPAREAILQYGVLALSGLDTLGEQILTDLWAAIENELEQPVEALDDHERERVYHERFVIDRTRLFLGRDEVVERVVDGLADTAGGNLIVISGRPGSGKSSLIAECTRRVREQNQDASVIPHFIGVSPDSAFLTNTLRSLCETLKRLCSLAEVVPEDPLEVRQKWPELLEKAGAQRRIIIFLDALNQLDPMDNSQELGWMPYKIPSGVTLVVSTLPGECFDHLCRRVKSEDMIDVSALAESDCKSLVEAHLGLRRKRLTQSQLELLLDATKHPEVGLPLYLLVALEELALFGNFEALNLRIARLPRTIAELFDQVLARLEQDHGHDMTASICRWLAVSRSGMLEPEIIDLLGQGKNGFPRARWSRFYRAIEPYLRPVDERTGEGLLAFYHDQLREAVFRRYLGMQSPHVQPTEAFRAAHAELANFFLQAAIEDGSKLTEWRWDQQRSLGELPHHQIHAGMWHNVERTLTDIAFIEAKSRMGMVRGLLHDYVEAERHWPGLEEERQADQQHRALIGKYVHDLVEYARWHNEWRSKNSRRLFLERWVRGRFRRKVSLSLIPGAPQMPDPPLSAVWKPVQCQDGVAHAWTKWQRVGAWRNMVWNHTQALTDGDEQAFQIAFNSTDSGPVMDTLYERLENGGGPVRPWLLRINRPEYSERPACLKILHGHVGEVHAVAVTADGRRVVSGSSDKTLRVWDLETGESRVLSGHAGTVLALALTPDGHWAVSGSSDKTLRIWDLDTGDSQIFSGHAESVNAVSVTPDGRRVLSASLDGMFRIWDVKEGKSSVLPGTVQEVEAVYLSPDGRFAICRSRRDHGIPGIQHRVWNLETGEWKYHDDDLKHVIGDHTVAVTPDRRRVISVVGTGMALEARYIAEPENHVLAPREIRKRDELKEIGRAAYLKTKETLKTPEGRLFIGHTRGITTVCVTADGRYAISGSKDTTLRVWDLEMGDSEELVNTPDKKVYQTESILLGGRRVLSKGTDHSLHSWDLDTGHHIVLHEGVSKINAVNVGLDGKWAISAGIDCRGHAEDPQIWNLDLGESRTLSYWSKGGATVCVTPDGQCAITAGSSKPELWKLETASSLGLLAPRDCREPLLTPDGRWLLSVENHDPQEWSDDGVADPWAGYRETLHVWDLKTGELRVFEGDGTKIKKVHVTPDGLCVVCNTEKAQIILSLSSGKQIDGLNDYFSPVSKWIVMRSSKGSVEVWDEKSDECIAYYNVQNGVGPIVESFPKFAVGTMGGIEILQLSEAGGTAPMALTSRPRLVTPVRIWHCDLIPGGHWDDYVKTFCKSCGKWVPTPAVVLDTIAAITHNVGLGPDDSPYFKLPTNVWDEPRLISQCPVCHISLKFTPFVVDNRDRMFADVFL